MLTHATALTPLELKSAIAREPLIVSPDTTVRSAIALMSGVRSLCAANKTADSQLDELHEKVRSSCVLVVENERLLGILTERDVVRLIAQQQPLDRLVMQQVMAHPAVTLRESDFTDLFFAINLLQQHQIRHLPILDEHDRLVGLVTHESLRQISRPIDLLRLRMVAEVMTSEVIVATPDCHLRAIAQQMANHHISSVIIVEQGSSSTEPLQIPLGIVTERDMVQFQALGLNLDNCTAQAVMSTPICAVKPDDSLWNVQQIMDQRLIRRLAVTGEQGELLGIVTQTSLLQALNPLELYKLVEVLDSQVVRLEAEKVALLENRNVELEQQVQARTVALETKAKQERLLNTIADRIRSSLNLEDILDTTVREIRSLLGCDRVIIYQFRPDFSGTVIAEAITGTGRSVLNTEAHDPCISAEWLEPYRNGKIRIINDIYNEAMTQCHQELLVGFEIRAKLMVPIVVEEQLWGLMLASYRAVPHTWTTDEIELIRQVSLQVASALQQAITHQRLQKELTKRRKVEVLLVESEERYATLVTAAPVGIFRTDLAGKLTYINDRYCQISGLTPTTAIGKGWQQGLHPDERDWVTAEWEQSVSENHPFQLEYRFQRPDGKVTWVCGQSVSELDADGQVVGYVGTVTDISDHKRTETQLLESEGRYATLVEASPVGIFRTDAVGNCIYVNDRWCQISGITPTTAFGDGWREGLHSDDRVALPTEWQQSMEENRPFQLEYRFQRPDGGVTWVYGQSVAELDAEGQVVGYVGTVTDISDRKQAEQQLQQLNQELEAKIVERTQELWQVNSLQRAILNGADYSIISTDPTGIIQTFNAAAEEMLGYSAAEIVGIVTPALIHDAREVIDRAASLCAELGQYVPPGFEVLVAKARQGIVSEEEWSYIRKDGSRFPVLLSITPLKDVNQQIMGFLGIAKDITERKRAEAELQKLSDRLALSLKSGAIGSWEWDIEQNTILGDERIYELFGFTKQSDSPIAYDTWANGLHPDDRTSTETLLHQAVLGQAEYDTEYRVLHPDGSVHFIKANGVVVRDAQGNPQSMIGINFDISDRKQAEAERQQLIQELSAFKLALDHSAIVAITDAQGVINYANDRFCDISGYSRDELIGQTHRIVNSGYHLPAFFQELWRTTSSGQIWRGEICNRTKNGSLYWLASTIVPFLDEQRQPFQYLAIRFDITARKLAQATLQQENTFRQQIVENMAEGLCVFHEVEEFPFIRFTVWNRQMQAITGYTLEDINRLGWYQSLYPDPRDREQAIARLGQMWQGENQIAQEREIQRQDGHKRTVTISTSVLSSHDGLTHLLILIQDITERKETEQAMTQQLAAIEAAIDGIAIMQGDTYLYLNQAHLELFGYEYPEELVGKNWSGLYSLEELERFEQEVFPVLGRDRAWEGEAIATRKDGSTFSEGLSLTLTEDGLLICVCRDISDRKQTELRLQQQAKQERLLGAITQRVRSSLNLDEVLNTTVEEIRQVLQSDRALVYRVFPGGTGAAIAESVLPKWPKILDILFPQEVFPEENYERYIQGRVYALCDREDENQPVLPCLIQFLSKIQVRAKLVVPIVQNHTLWGLLIVHQCDLPRQWEDWEINLLKQTANQLAIAIQQANLYEQVQSELVIRKQTEEAIALQLQRQRTLGVIVQQIRQSLDINQILVTVTQQVKEILRGDRVIVFRLFGNGKSQIVKESVSSQFPALKDRQWDNEVWSQEILQYYWQGKPRIVPDVMTDISSDCLVEYCIEGQIQSKIVAPILQEVRGSENDRWVAPDQSNKLWGVLVIHACREKRVWQESEAQLLQQIANQLAIAIQQAHLFEQLQQELTERQQAQQQVTERNQQLAVSNEELARATRLKDEFLANMSHELRTPLNAILGMTEGLQEAVFGIVNEAQIKALQTIERSGFHLLELINDILDVAKIESGQMELDFTPVSINRLCQSSLAFIKQQAMQKRLQLEIKIPLNLPDFLIDERRIRQVLINLLNNAVKFTPEGGRITLEVTRHKRATVLVPHDLQGDTKVMLYQTPFEQELALKPQEEGLELKDYLRIAVIDTGIGIAPENINKLFQPFIQIDSALNRQYAGTGLGLALVKRIVELHGGQVGLTSQVGLGSCFTIDLPGVARELSSPNLSSPNLSASNLKSQAESPIEFFQPEKEASPLILLAEDNEANISTVTSYLKAKGYRIVLAKNGEEAIALAKSENPNIILMDIQMPGLDGLEAMEHIRRDPNLVNVPIIALTALAMTGDRDRCLAAGANDYLTKPVKLKQLVSSIQQLLAP
ncbi:PAS domain S-box protein [Lyngbya sp. CCAP 1446/10]|uniref:PAS domain S-box protein n=1 Tax=Lyngbya sp. CCAP 1446/10 TaxID=439293 RepID=UPI002238B40C|nr:PAS domain S-box protein [Lyngbya sp. CCAP 1446/10]MCW6052149.1 PAS domain S-box protein [Lyngbya sp. CCAP 1446/10]